MICRFCEEQRCSDRLSLCTSSTTPVCMASTQRLPQAVPRAAATVAADEDLDESAEAVTKEVFKPYQCRCSSIVAKGAVPHAGDIAEASSLRCVVVVQTGYIYAFAVRQFKYSVG